MRTRNSGPARRRPGRFAAAALAVVTVLAAIGPGQAFADGEYLPPSVTVPAPDTSGCPQKTAPAPPVDTSEDVAPGETTPTPLPVPVEPVGGPAMGSCDFLLPTDAPALPPDISARAWLVADLTTDQVLGGKDVHGRYRPASTLKLLTMLVLWRNLPDVDQIVLGTDDDANQEGSRVGIGDGGSYTVHQLLLGLMLNSGNDAANALARANGGTAKTIDEMNATAAAIGALDTRAATVSGLDGPGQQTSAYDLALIMNANLALPGFSQLLSTETAMFPGFGEYPEFGIANDNKLLTNYVGALGGKTGFTDDAGNTFVGVAERNGHRLVVTMLGGTQQPRRQWMQAASLLDWGFAVHSAGLNPVGRLVEPGADLDASSSAASAAAEFSSSAASMTTQAPTTGNVPASEPISYSAAPADDDRTGLSSLLWVVGLLLLIVVGAVGTMLVRRRRSARVAEADTVADGDVTTSEGPLSAASPVTIDDSAATDPVPAADAAPAASDPAPVGDGAPPTDGAASQPTDGAASPPADGAASQPTDPPATASDTKT